MSLLLFIAIVVIVLILALYVVDLLPLGEPPLKQILKVLFVLMAILVIVQRAGLFNGLG